MPVRDHGFKYSQHQVNCAALLNLLFVAISLGLLQEINSRHAQPGAPYPFGDRQHDLLRIPAHILVHGNRAVNSRIL